MAARSIAIQRMPLAAKMPQRSPFFKPFDARNVRAFRTNSSNSAPGYVGELAVANLLQDPDIGRSFELRENVSDEGHDVCTGTGTT